MLFRLFIVLCGVAVLGFALLARAADARWKPEYASADPAIQQWYGTQHNDKGQWCCNDADGHPYFGGYSINADGGVTLTGEDGKVYTLPSYMVLKGPNPTGHAVWWFLEIGSTHRDYCFAPGGGA